MRAIVVAALMLPIAIALYYLAWKHVVGFFNKLVGVMR